MQSFEEFVFSFAAGVIVAFTSHAPQRTNTMLTCLLAWRFTRVSEDNQSTSLGLRFLIEFVVRFVVDVVMVDVSIPLFFLFGTEVLGILPGRPLTGETCGLKGYALILQGKSPVVL
jgi:hypothetical protein